MSGNGGLAERIELQFRVEQFYYEEAAALDERRYDDWLELFAEDVHYWMPLRRTRTSSELDKEFTTPGDVALFDDDLKMLALRVRRLDTGYAWAEDPPSRTRHMITNIRVGTVGEAGIEVESSFHVYRTRLNSEEDNWIGRRRDLLRPREQSFLIARRHILLDQTVVLSRNLSNFF